MEFFTEARLDSNTEARLRKNGIRTTSDDLSEIHGKNAIIDTRQYQSLGDKAFMDKLKMLASNSTEYDNKIVYLPVSKWARKSKQGVVMSDTPLGAILRHIKSNPTQFKADFAGFVFIFYNDNKEYFALYPDIYKSSEYKTMENLINVLVSSHVTHNLTGGDVKSPVKDVAKNTDKMSKAELAEKKQELVDAIAAAASSSDSEEEAWNKLADDEFVKELISELEEEDDGKPKFNAVRTSRMAKLNDEFLNKTIKGQKISDIISPKEVQKIMSTHLKVNSINDEWKDMKFKSIQDSYDVNSDIMKILESFSKKSYPISVIDIKVEDTSTAMDYIDTYTVNVEDGFGKRSTLIFDVPRFKNKRFMRLRGNEKVMSGQLVLLPCIKTDQDTVQCVSNYNKIFIRRKGLEGRSYPSSDKLIKTLRKLNSPNIKVFYGDNKAICSKYELPVDYIDIASQINRIESRLYIFYFNQDMYYTKFNANKKEGIPIAISRVDNSVIYYKGDQDILISNAIAGLLYEEDEDFKALYNKTKYALRLNYSEASILSNRIPLVVVLGYSIGLEGLKNLLKSTDINYVDKKTSYDPDKFAIVRFKDKNLKYTINYSSSMLLNGLSECPTEDYNISDLNKRSTWLDFLDEFGGRILADGLDNFVDLFIDPITEEVCNHCKIPSDYFEMLVYANNLLADNKYNRHTDISGNRFRTTELVAGYTYKVLAKAYADYKSQVKRGRKVGISVKRSAVIDALMQDPMTSDLSILNPLLEIEAANSVSFKGLSGMNSDRSYGLDKRTYDDSMINKLALSTGFAANVGINRQTTIDMDISDKRGYINQSKPDDMSVSKSFSMTEAVTPFGTTHDDPFRSAMTFIQTSKHSMRTKKSMPLLITNGADEAMPYISSDTFAYKAKENGSVTVITKDYMIVTYDKAVYDDGNHSYLSECVDLKEEVKKSSDGGFYITLKLDTDLKVGDKFKKGDIIAYDRSSYSNKNGEDDNLSYNVGVLAKVAILNTDEGFEDSTSISNWLSEAMATDIVTQKEKDLSKNTNVYEMVKVGQKVQEGDPLLIVQNAFDDKDANALLKNITDPDFVSDLGRVKLKSKYTGVVQDIKIYRTCEIKDMSPSLQKIVTEYEQGIKNQKKLYEKYKMPGANMLDPDYKMAPTGIMKNNPDGVKIVFYIMYNDKMSVGDKLVAQSANKGVVKRIFPTGLEPFSEYRPEEKIHAVFAARSFNARMVTSVWVSGAINKCMVELDRQVKEIMGIDTKPIEEME